MNRSFLANRATRVVTLFTAAIATASLLATSAGAATTDSFPCHAGSGPSRDINTYVLFGISSFNFKGGQGAGRGIVANGNIGVQKAGGDADIGQNNSITTSTGSTVAADDVTVGAESNVYNVHANSGTINSAADINGDAPICYTLPTVNNLPADKVVTPGTSPANDVTVNNANSPLTLAPGHYGKLSVTDGTTLNLGDGEYDFIELSTGKDFTINTTSKTDVRLATDANFGDGGVIQGSDLASFYVNGAGNSIVQFGKQTTFHGQIYAPNGQLKLGHTTDLFGRFWADTLGSDVNVNVTYSAPGYVKGLKFEDTNGNGQQDAGEGALSGFTFYVDYNDNGALDPGEPQATSDAQGNYEISPIEPGTWNVRETGGAAGYTCTFPGSGLNCVHAVTVGTSGITGPGVDGVDFGNKPPPCIPTAGQDANCQPIVTPKCVPTAGQDKNCKPIVETAKITGVKGGCSTVQKIRVSGSNIKKVTYKIDGKTVKTVKKKPYSYTLKTKNYKVGAHKLKVTTTFASGKTQTKTYTFQHCKAVAPRFTG